MVAGASDVSIEESISLTERGCTVKLKENG